MPSLEKNIILHSHTEIEISFKFIPKILMSKECIHFWGPLCMYIIDVAHLVGIKKASNGLRIL